MSRPFHRTLGSLAVLLVAAAAVPVAWAQAGGSESDFIYAKKLYDDGLYDLAAEALQAYIYANPDSPDKVQAMMLIGEARFADGEYAAARTAFQQVALDFPDSPQAPRALMRVADCYRAAGDEEKTARALLRIPVFRPNSDEAPAALLAAARIYVDRERWEDAESPLQQIINQYAGSPQVWPARLLWARLLAGRGELDAAVVEAGKVALKADDKELSAKALFHRGEWLSRLGREDEAETVWEELIAGYPGLPQQAAALARLGRRKIQAGDLEGARDLFQKALESSQDSAVTAAANLGLGDVLFLLGQFEGSLSAYRAADTSDVAVRFREAVTLEKLGAVEEALAIYRSLVEGGGPFASSAAWRSGDLLARSGRADKAAGSFLAAESLFPDSGKKAQSRYRAAEVLRMVRPRKARELLAGFEGSYPTSPRVDDAAGLRAEASLRLGEADSAAAEWERLAEKYPFSPLAVDARRKAEELRRFVIRTTDPAAKVASLLAEVALGLDRSELSLRLGEIYLNDYKNFAAAQAQFQSVLDDTTAPPERVKQARRDLVEAIWREWKVARLAAGPGEGDSLSLSAGVDEVLHRLEGIAARETDPGVAGEIAYRMIRLRLSALQGEERIRLARSAWQGFLADYPGSPRAPAVYLALAKAFLDTLTRDTLSGDTLSAEADPATWFLETLRDRYPEAPGRAEGLLLLARRYRDAGRGEEALASYHQLLELPPDPYHVEAMVDLMRSSLLEDTEKLTLAGRLQVEAFYHPAAGEMKRETAKLLFNAGRARDAVEAFKALQREHDPGDPGILTLEAGTHVYSAWLARAFEALGEAKRSITEYRRYLAYHPAGEFAEFSHRHLADLFLARREPEDALREYRWLLEHGKDGENLDQARRVSNRLMMQARKYEKARSFALEVVLWTADEDTAFEYSQLATVCLYRVGKLEEAREEASGLRKRFKDRDDLDESTARFFVEKGRWYSRRKNWPEAEKAYKTVLRKYRKTSWVVEAKYELGRDYLTRNLYDEGMKLLTALPDEYPESSILGQVWWTLGNELVKNGNVLDGVAYYERILANDRWKAMWPYVYRNLIQAYKQAGFYAGALRAIKGYLERFPDAEDAFQRKMDIGLLYLEMEQYDLAIAQYRALKPLANVEQEAAAQYYIGEALEKQGRYAEAIIEYKKVDYLGKRTKLQWAITAIYSAGRCFEKLGQPGKAEEMYREIVGREGLGSPFGRKAQEQIERLHAEAGKSRG